MTFLLRFSFFGSLSKDQWGLDDFWRISCEILEYPLGFVSVFFQILVRDPFGFSHEPSRSCFARARCLGEEKTTRALGGILSILKRRLNHPRMMNHFLLISESMIYLTDEGGGVNWAIESGWTGSIPDPIWWVGNGTEMKPDGSHWNHGLKMNWELMKRGGATMIIRHIDSVCLSVCLSVC